MIRKEELIALLTQLGIPFNEGISSEDNNNITPRVVFWEFMWSPQSASSKTYNTVVTYQVSMYSNRPRDPKLVELKNLLGENGLRPIISHEFVEDLRQFHSYLAIDVIETL